jgi:hypothetical protein
MEPFEIPSVFPIDATDTERELGFERLAISLAGFGGGGNDTLLRVLARRVSASDILLKILHEGQIRYRPMRHGYRPVFGLRLPWVKPRWHPMTEGLSDDPGANTEAINSRVVPVPFTV